LRFLADRASRGKSSVIGSPGSIRNDFGCRGFKQSEAEFFGIDLGVTVVNIKDVEI
jgi:hypothetical protein